MREVTLQIRHHGEPESDISADYPAITIRSVSSMTGSAAERKRIIEITGPEASIAGFLEEFEAADPVIDVDTLTPLDVPRVLVAVTIDSYQWDSIAQRLTDLGVHYRTGAVISAGWERWTLYLAEDDDLNEIVESIERPGNETDLVRNVELGVVAEQEQLEFSRVINELTSDSARCWGPPSNSVTTGRKRRPASRTSPMPWYRLHDGVGTPRPRGDESDGGGRKARQFERVDANDSNDATGETENLFLRVLVCESNVSAIPAAFSSPLPEMRSNASADRNRRRPGVLCAC
ncbi:hypothetical protein [Haladaptatus sp. R4]|uniref:hypothetical protein n=1 Tax=Haladaptatus sp. R4 TaxID=1679489 RepID=UPI000AD5B919|nr:hypothetical protein [Haladaptatus sp. R4]